MTTENTTIEPTAEELAAKTAAENKEPAQLDLSGSGEKAPPVKEPATKEPEKDEKPEPFEYNPSGDAGLDMLLEAAGGLGLGPEHPAMQAAIRGDFDLLALKLEEADVKGASRLIALGQKAYKDVSEKTKTKQAEDQAAVHKEVGGPEEWAAIQSWASENADDDEKKVISAQLSKGGVEARMAAAWLRTNYDRANGAVATEGTGKTVTAVPVKGSAGGTGTLSSREYAKAVAEARVGFKGDFENSRVYKQLQERRLAHRD